MHPQIIRDYELRVAGIETASSAATLAQDMATQGERGDALGLTETIRHRVDMNRYVALLWNWSASDDFPLMCGAEVTSAEGQPDLCVIRQFPACDYAIFPMAGAMPNLVEPWPEILAWYPLDAGGFTTTIRRYDERTGAGEILVPLRSNLQPTG